MTPEGSQTAEQKRRGNKKKKKPSVCTGEKRKGLQCGPGASIKNGGRGGKTEPELSRGRTFPQSHGPWTKLPEPSLRRKQRKTLQARIFEATM